MQLMKAEPEQLFALENYLIKHNSEFRPGYTSIKARRVERPWANLSITSELEDSILHKLFLFRLYQISDPSKQITELFVKGMGIEEIDFLMASGTLLKKQHDNKVPDWFNEVFSTMLSLVISNDAKNKLPIEKSKVKAKVEG